MDKIKQDFYFDTILLTFFISIAIISIALDVGAYIANSRAIEFVNQDVTYFKNMQIALPNIPSLDNVILTQECNSILISSVQSTFSFYSLATIFLVVVGIFIVRKKIDIFDKQASNFRLIFKHGNKVFTLLFFIFFAVSLVFFSLALGLEQSKDQSITQMLGDITSNEVGQEDKLILLETFVFDTSQNHFDNLFYGFYLLIIGLSFLLASLIQFLKKGPNLLSSVILYSSIIGAIYLTLLLMNSPVQGYSSIIASEDFDLFCKDIVHPEEQFLNNTLDEESSLNNTTDEPQSNNTIDELILNSTSDK